MILDCSSLETTLASLEPLLGATQEQIKSRLLEPELDPANEIVATEDISDLLLRSFPNRTDSWPYSSIVWFHLTRTFDVQRYLGGISPVTHIIDLIWADLKAACDKEEIMLNWQELRRWVETESSGHYAKLYRLKQEPGMQGPYGMLFLESALHPNPGDNHYLRCPETIEDICKEVEAKTGIEIIGPYQRNTRPAVVKFLDHAPSEEYAKAAIFYVYGSLWELEYDCDWNRYFDGEGNAIPASMIMSADYIGSLLDI